MGWRGKKNQENGVGVRGKGEIREGEGRTGERRIERYEIKEREGM